MPMPMPLFIAMFFSAAADAAFITPLFFHAITPSATLRSLMPPLLPPRLIYDDADAAADAAAADLMLLLLLC